MIEEIKKAVEVLQNGGIILYPTDTIWGIGCDATNPEAVKRVYEIKQRIDSKALLVLLDSENRLQQYVSEVPEVAWELIEVTDKPLTLIYSGAKNLAPNLIADDGSVGIRIANDEFCEKLIGRFKKPIVSTSANISGHSAPAIFDEISDDIKSGVDYIVQHRQDDISKKPASSIIKIDASGKFHIIR
jgi:L-threonylcarbamoyladenylate synthase